MLQHDNAMSEKSDECNEQGTAEKSKTGITSFKRKRLLFVLWKAILSGPVPHGGGGPEEVQES